MGLNFRSTKGGATVYVLMTMLMLIIILVSIYTSFTNKHLVELDTAEQIKTIYEEDLNNMDIIYNNIVSNS